MAKPKRQSSSRPDENPVQSVSDTKAPESKGDEAVIAPTRSRPQPFAFIISLALFIGWLLYLAYVAYKVAS